MDSLMLLLVGLGLLVAVVIHLGLKARNEQHKIDAEKHGPSTTPPPAEASAQRRRLRDGPDPAFGREVDVECDTSKCWFDVVGEASYQGALRMAAGDRLLMGEEFYVDCIIAPEPDNPYDAGAMAVYIAGVGKVGYFSREDLAGTYGALRDRLTIERAVGLCRGKLTGGWEEDIHIGVRLALLRPSDIRGEGRSSDEDVLTPPDGWAERQRVELPAGKGWLNLIEESGCQAELRKLVEDRNVSRETVGFFAVLVPAAEGVIVCADGGGAVGKLGRGDVTRFAHLIAHLQAHNLVATCGGWVVEEGVRLGAKVTISGPKTVLKTLGIEPSGAA